MTREREPVDRRERPRERERIGMSPQETLREIGRFGVVDARFYEPDWIRKFSATGALSYINRSEGVAILTRDGRGAARHLCGHDHTLVILGKVKDNRIEHDLAVHRLYCRERLAIEKDGGRLLEIRTEVEFKRDLGRATFRSRNMRAATDDFARANDLRVVDGQLRIPDCRIVYEIEGRQQPPLDLEIASAHLGSKAVAAKQMSGMKVVDRNTVSGSRDGHDDMARMLR